jgi:hypothetical protein
MRRRRLLLDVSSGGTVSLFETIPIEGAVGLERNVSIAGIAGIEGTCQYPAEM